MTLTTPKSTTFTYREVALHDRLREVAREVAMKLARARSRKRSCSSEPERRSRRTS